MSYLIGEFECKLDTKGRMMIPSGLKKQLPEAESDRAEADQSGALRHRPAAGRRHGSQTHHGHRDL